MYHTGKGTLIPWNWLADKKICMTMSCPYGHYPSILLFQKKKRKKSIIRHIYSWLVETLSDFIPGVVAVLRPRSISLLCHGCWLTDLGPPTYSQPNLLHWRKMGRGGGHRWVNKKQEKLPPPLSIAGAAEWSSRAILVSLGFHCTSFHPAPSPRSSGWYTLGREVAYGAPSLSVEITLIQGDKWENHTCGV